MPEELIRQRCRVAIGRYARRMYVAVQPLVALIAGVLILAMPRLLNYIVALYLILIGILGLVKF
jgi:uncharacterized membrane protein YdbT with pleckstrin-like domain